MSSGSGSTPTASPRPRSRAQGSNQIVVEIPGEVDDETIALISKAAQMKFRPVLTYGAPQPTAAAEPSASPSASGDDAAADGGEAATAEETAALEKKITEEAKDVDPTDPSDLAQITPSVQQLYDELDCTDPKNLEGGGGDHPDQVLVTCDQTGAAKYILGPVEVDGTNLSSAASGLMPGANGTVTNKWVVTLEFNSEGATQFRETTERLVSLESPRNQFAIVLDGLIVSAPSINGRSRTARPRSPASFTQESAATLANQLSFGSLPLTFEVEGENQISATLGSEQLQRGLFAGLIGLALVVVYSMFQYRTLGLLTVTSLVVAGAMTYVVIALLSWGMGYRLSLPGIAGLIVAIGFTADSFIVYFERIRDELRDGRTLRLAVQRGWVRARRTVLASEVREPALGSDPVLHDGRRRARLRVHPGPDHDHRHHGGLLVHAPGHGAHREDPVLPRRPQVVGPLGRPPGPEQRSAVPGCRPVLRPEAARGGRS